MLQIQHFLIVGDDVIEVIVSSIHLGDFAAVSLKIVFKFGHAVVQMSNFFDIPEDNCTGCTDDFMIVDQRNSIGDDHGAVDFLKLHEFFDTCLGNDMKTGVFNDFCDMTADSGGCLYIKKFLIVPFDDIAVTVDETHTIMLSIENIG